MNQVTPGGIISVKHRWPNKKEYNNQDTFLTINHEPIENSYYFWAQQFWFISGDGGYLGLQTGGQINGLITKIAIFSVWNALDAKKENLTGSWAGTFGGEGTGFSCKIPFNWRQNVQYRLRLIKIANLNTHINSNWWIAFIQEVYTGNEESIGQILLPTQWGGLTMDSNFFVEYFLPVSGCENIPFAQATLHKLSREHNITPIEVPTYETYGVCASNGRVTYRQDCSILLETGMKNNYRNTKTQ